MNREQAEKLLAALIFDDLDETSKAELTAYLQTDDELRYRLADLRMAVKLADDAVNEGPDPVLGEQRLKQLKRLAKADKAKMRAFRNVRLLAIAAVLMFAFLLVGTSIFSFSGRRTFSTRSFLASDVRQYRSEPASRPALRSPPAVATAPAISNSPVVTHTDGDGVHNMLFNGREGRVGGMGGMGGMASDKKDNSGTNGMMGGMGDSNGDVLGKQVATASEASERNRGVYAGVKIQTQQAAPSDAPATPQPDSQLPAALSPSAALPRSLFRSPAKRSKSKEVQSAPMETAAGPSSSMEIGKEILNRQIAADEERVLRKLEEQRAAARRETVADTVARSPLGEPAPQVQERQVAKDAAGKPVTMESESTLRLGRGVSDKEADAGGGIYQSSRGNKTAEPPAAADMLTISGTVGNHAANYDLPVPYGWKGTITPEKSAAPVFSPAPSAPVATNVKKADQLSETLSTTAPTEESEKRVAALGDVPLVGRLFRKDVQPEANAEAPGQATGEIAYPTPWGKVVDESGKLDQRPADSDSAVKMKVEQNAPSAGVVMYHDGAVTEETVNMPSSSHFKVVPVNPWVLTAQDALSTFALDVDTASYALCRRYIRNGYLPPIGAVRMEEFINAFDYAYPQRDDQPFTVYAEGTPSPFAPVGQNLTLLKVAIKARNVGRDQRRAANLVFVVDASASMGQADRLPQVQAAASQLVDKLSEGDRVSLITCAGDARLHLEAVPARQKDAIHETINAIQPAGPTNLLAGLKLGYAMARKNFVAGQTNEVVLCSDGVANVGQTEAEAMLQEVAEDRKQAITLTCMGVGYGAYNDAFLEALANQGDGRYVFLDSSEKAQEALVGQLAASLESVAQDARIQVQFNPNRVRRYRLIGYENRDIEDQRFRDDTVDAGAVGSGQCSTALYELELVGSRESGMGVPPMQHRRDADATTEGADLGTVFVRYRNTETGQMEEISRPLAGSIVRRRGVEEDPRFFLAAGAARFAEWLRQSEHAQNTALPEVQRLLDQVSAALPLDRDVRDLAALAHQAEGLPRAPEATPAPEVQK